MIYDWNMLENVLARVKKTQHYTYIIWMENGLVDKYMFLQKKEILHGIVQCVYRKQKNKTKL